MKKLLSIFLALVMILSVGTIAVSAYDVVDYVWVYTSRFGAKVDNYLYFPVYYDDDTYFASYGDENSIIKITFPFCYDSKVLKPVDVMPSELLYGMEFTGEIIREDVYYYENSSDSTPQSYIYAEITFDGSKKIEQGEILFNVKFEIIGEPTRNNGGEIFDSFFIVEDLENEVLTCCRWEVIDGNGNVTDISSKIQHNYRLDIDGTEDNLILNNYVPFIPPVSDISAVDYIQSEDTRKTFTVTANGRQSMIQFIEPDGGTRTYDRYNKNVSITSYDADGNEVSAMSRDLAYEVWSIYSNMSVGNEIKVRGKENGVWDSVKYSFTVEPYNPVVSMELSSTSGNKGAVPATVVADEKTEKVMFKMPNGTSTTVASTSTDENGNKIFTGKAWMNEDGINEIKVYIRRDNVWIYVGSLNYMVYPDA